VRLISALAHVSGLTLISRLLGLVRDLVLAQMFGADARTDAFLVAFKIPHLFRRFFVEGAFANALVPLLTQYRGQGLSGFLAAVSGSAAAILAVGTFMGMLAAPILVVLFAPGFVLDSGQWEESTALLRLTLPYVFFIGLTAFSGAVLNAHGRFALPAFTPVVLNLVLISFALWLSPQLEAPIYALAWAVLVAGLIQLGLQLPALGRLGLLPRPTLGVSHPGVRQLWQQMPKVLLGVSVLQLNLLVDTLFASFLAEGTISWLYYAERLLDFPLGLLGVALATVILPGLSQQHAEKAPEVFSRILGWALRWVLLFAVPAAVALWLLAYPIMATLFASAVFDDEDVAMAALALAAYAPGIVAFVAAKVLMPAFFARGDSQTPMRVALWSLAINVLLNLILVGPMGHAGLALATSLSAWMTASWLLWLLIRDGVYCWGTDWWRLTWRTLLAVVMMAGLVMGLQEEIGVWVEMSRWEKAYNLLSLVVLGGMGFFFVLWASGIRRRDMSEPPGK
jgi:putative peptidoglycan lipid II flippase